MHFILPIYSTRISNENDKPFYLMIIQETFLSSINIGTRDVIQIEIIPWFCNKGVIKVLCTNQSAVQKYTCILTPVTVGPPYCAKFGRRRKTTAVCSVQTSHSDNADLFRTLLLGQIRFSATTASQNGSETR